MDGDVLTHVKHLGPTLLLISLCFLSTSGGAQSEDRSLLVVTGDQSSIAAVTRSDLRRIFLGVPVTIDGVRIRPLLNATDPLAMDIFLQNIVFMSEREYQRQLLSRVFRLGDQRPKEYDEIEDLIAELEAAPEAISFMWSNELSDRPNLKSLGVLWASSDD